MRGRRFDTLDDLCAAMEASTVRDWPGWYCTVDNYDVDNQSNLYFIPPVDKEGRHGGLCSIPLDGSQGWQAVEGPNGLTVTPSIFLNMNALIPGWHGFLTDGEWSTV